MTTAQRLQSILNSKTAIANAIRTRGGTLANNAALAAYAPAILAIPETYPLDTMGFDSDGSLASSISGTMSKWQGKAATASYASMFNNNSTVRVIPNIDFSKTSSLYQFANNASALQYVPYINALKATTLYAAFRLTAVKYFPGINAPLCTEANMLFNGGAVEYIGEVLLPNATTYRSMFNGCENFVAAGKWTLNNDSPNASLMFYNCKALRQFIEEDFAPSDTTQMFVGCSNLSEVRMNLRNATVTTTMFGTQASNGTPDCAAWFNWGEDSGAEMPASPGLKRYAPEQTTLDFRGLINWGTLHPASLQYTLENLPTRAYTNASYQGVVDTVCTIYFSAATKAALTAEQKTLITSKNYKLG